MPRSVKVKVTLPYLSGLATDVAVNTFSFVEDTSGTLSDLATNVANFYTQDPGAGGLAVGKYFSSYISRETQACKVEVYDRAHPTGTAPDTRLDFTLPAAAAGVNLPEECAAVLTMDRGTLSSRQERGRVFLGPLTANALQNTGTGSPMYLATDFIAAVLASAEEHLELANLSDSWNWVIHSAIAGDNEVLRISMDNAPDTMRSRGPKPTGRTAVTF